MQRLEPKIKLTEHFTSLTLPDPLKYIYLERKDDVFLGRLISVDYSLIPSFVNNE
jgi:hypothetical protein